MQDRAGGGRGKGQGGVCGGLEPETGFSKEPGEFEIQIWPFGLSRRYIGQRRSTEPILFNSALA